MAEEGKEIKAETGGVTERHDKKELSMRYLAALIQYADWIPEEYKKLVTKNSSVEMLQKIYLCACDRVPLEKVKEAQNKKDGVKELAKLRHEHFRKLLERESGNELGELHKRMSEAEAKIVEQEHKLKNVPKFGTGYQEEKVQSNIKEKVAETNIRLPLYNQKHRFFQRKESPTEFLSEIVEIYNADQLQFIMDCIEEEIPIRNIRTFISPALPVEIMQRLKKIEQDKGGRKKWNRIEK